MDDLEFIKKDVRKHLHEGRVFNDCLGMLRALLREITEIYHDAEEFAPGSDTTEMLADIVRKYSDARVR